VVPGVLAIMAFAPLIIVIFYSSQFMDAIDILRWQMLGGVLQAVTWPMGYMIRAQGNGKLIFWTELSAGGLLLGPAWSGMALFGLPGIGMSFFARDLFYLLLMYWIVRKNYRFAFSGATLRVFIVSILATGMVFLSTFFLAKEMQLIVCAGITLLAAIYSVKTLIFKTSMDMIPGFLFKIKALFGVGGN
jgi:PST family polysaccharide transporter